MSAPHTLHAIFAALVALSCTLPLHRTANAANWRTVIVGKTETIEIDKDRISRNIGGTTGWSRITLDREVKDPGGAYNSIHAQVLYDCEGRRFTTLKRAYFNGDSLVREEAVSRQRANPARIGSIDERLLSEACRSPVTTDAIAASNNRSVIPATEGDRSGAIRADMQTLNADERTRLIPVADATPKPVVPIPAPPPAQPPAAGKSGRIELPPIDKAAAHEAATLASKSAAAAHAPAAPTAPSHAPTTAPHTETKPVAPHAAPALKADAHAAPPAAASHTAPTPSAHETPNEKRLRELQYATSGPPRKVVRKRASPHANPAAQMHAHWEYDGEHGPANWGKLKDEFAACSSGKRQSPIDIREGIKVDLERIQFDYRPTQFRIIDNGHTVQVNVGEGMTITVQGKRYELLQFHFHRPSEERVGGRSYDMVAHLVHKNEDNQLAVVALLMEVGAEHPVIQTLWNHMPLEKNQEVSPADAINLTSLLPENRTYWTYMGSLTTPPCTEGVLWIVMKQPVQISSEQISIFSRLYRRNARPVQPANGRMIKESR